MEVKEKKKKRERERPNPVGAESKLNFGLENKENIFAPTGLGLSLSLFFFFSLTSIRLEILSIYPSSGPILENITQVYIVECLYRLNFCCESGKEALDQ